MRCIENGRASEWVVCGWHLNKVGSHGECGGGGVMHRKFLGWGGACGGLAGEPGVCGRWLRRGGSCGGKSELNWGGGGG